MNLAFLRCFPAERSIEELTARMPVAVLEMVFLLYRSVLKGWLSNRYLVGFYYSSFLPCSSCLIK